MNTQTNALVLGASGLVGTELLKQLLADDSFSSIQVLVRKPLELKDSKIICSVVDFNKPELFADVILPGKAVFCAIGTTIKKVKGDKAAYERIDIHIPKNVAVAAKQKGYTKFFLVSSVGADSDASNYYLRIKGKSESAVQAGFEVLGIFRPSMLLGERKETRLAESVAKGVMSVFSPLFIGRMKRYKPIFATKVAAAMVQASKQQTEPVRIYENEELHT